jgi:ketosteroid isomerase-like protein
MATTAEAVFESMRDQWLGPPGELSGDHLTDDVIVEIPFAAPGRPTRFVGKRHFLEAVNPQRAALQVRFDECRTTAVHHTTDPDTIIVEYELAGTSLKTNRQHTAAFIAVLTVRGGKVALWREYQNTMAILQALEDQPDIRQPS